MCDRARRFCLTLNNWSEEEYFKLLGHMDTKTFWIIGKEVGESGTPHLQCYVEHKNPMAFKTIKRWNERLHIEKSKGSRRQNYDYCSKDGNFQTNIQEKDLENEKKEKISETEYLTHYNRHVNVETEDKLNLVKFVLDNLDILILNPDRDCMINKLKNMFCWVSELSSCKGCNNEDYQFLGGEIKKVLKKHFNVQIPQPLKQS